MKTERHQWLYQPFVASCGWGLLNALVDLIVSVCGVCDVVLFVGWFCGVCCVCVVCVWGGGVICGGQGLWGGWCGVWVGLGVWLVEFGLWAVVWWWVVVGITSPTYGWVRDFQTFADAFQFGPQRKASKGHSPL